MKVRFWGTRGSIPVSVTAPDIRAKLLAALAGAVGRSLDTPEKIADYVDRQLGFETSGTFGGHSSCVELTGDDASHVILDMGSGARPLGQHLLEKYGPDAPRTYHVFMSHLHWDHIMGFPFFGPVYVPGNRIVIHGCHAGIEEAFRRQQAEPSFPVDFSQLAADVEFRRLTPGESYAIAGLRVTPKLQLHAGDSFGYRLEAGGKCVVYSTDSEHRLDNREEREGFIEFFGGADLVIFDAMYSLFEAISVKADWGHSSNIVGVELCQAARAKTLALFHHEPAFDDTRVASVLQETRRFEEITRDGHQLEVIAAYDGLELEV
ncbi:MAG TPA: MBL fold metallo-hydrolase [Burkholderiales bacterium]|jgi:phosphoribosyl 1,2-cyclic phosphodiesterase|nr:MBL fold metallo-hydrolase [Burkholderiales bacterium]